MTQQPELHSGIVKAFDAGTHTATIQLTGSLLLWLSAVPTDRGIAAADMVVGRKVAVVLFDPSNHTDAVVIAVYT